MPAPCPGAAGSGSQSDRRCASPNEPPPSATDARSSQSRSRHRQHRGALLPPDTRGHEARTGLPCAREPESGSRPVRAEAPARRREQERALLPPWGGDSRRSKQHYCCRDFPQPLIQLQKPCIFRALHTATGIRTKERGALHGAFGLLEPNQVPLPTALDRRIRAVTFCQLSARWRRIGLTWRPHDPW